MHIFVARHGKSRKNELRIITSDPDADYPLVEEGIDQAEELARQLRDKGIQHIYCSEVLRARQTAEILGERLHVEVTHDPRLNERDAGDLEGSSQEVKMRLVERDPYRTQLPNGESLQQVRERLERFLDELHSASFDRVLIVAHGAQTSAFIRIFNNVPDEKNVVQQATGTIAEYTL